MSFDGVPEGTDRGQSEVVGVILLTAVIVLIVGVFGAFFLGAVSESAGGYGPVVDTEVNVTTTEVSVTHVGGDSVAIDDLAVVLQEGSTSERYGFDAANVTGDGDADFDPTERFAREHGMGTGTMDVFVIHTPSDTVFRQFHVAVGVGEGPLVWANHADWDGASGESGVVHEAFGDRSAGAVELGYPSSGQWGPTPIAYWPLDEESGSTTTDVAGTNDGAIQSVTLGQGGLLGTTAYDFDAANEDHVTGATDIADVRGTATVSAWVNTLMTGEDTMWEAPGITGVESQGDGDDVFWGWINASGHVGVQSGDVAGAMSATPVNDENWHHVVLARDEATGEVEVYVDGTLEDTATSRTGTVTTTFDSIGRIEDTGGTPEYFDGRIEDLQVYDRVLTASEVSTLHDDVTDGSLTTGAKSFDSVRTPASLHLTGVSATLPAGTTASVTVESDPNEDGTFEESSDPISLQSGTTEYDVTGLSSNSQRFRVVVDLTTGDRSVSPSVGRLVLAS